MFDLPLLILLLSCHNRNEKQTSVERQRSRQLVHDGPHWVQQDRDEQQRDGRILFGCHRYWTYGIEHTAHNVVARNADPLKDANQGPAPPL